jgi:hypothetical protein
MTQSVPIRSSHALARSASALVLALVTALGAPVESGAQEDAEPFIGIQGEVLDGAGIPIAGVMVAALESGLITLTDASGYFAFPDLDPGRLEFGLYHVGYATFEGFVEVEPDEVLVFRMGQAPIQLEGIDVTVLRQWEREWRGYGERFDFVAPADMEVYRERYTTLSDVLRAHRIPGIWVNTSSGTGVEDQLCVTRTRAATSVVNSNTGCAMIVVDGQIIYYGSGDAADAGDPGLGMLFASGLNLEDVESVRWLSGMEAALRYGYIGEAGALLITTASGRAPQAGPGFTGRTRPPGTVKPPGGLPPLP